MTVKAIFGLLTFLCAFAGGRYCNTGRVQKAIADPRIFMKTPEVIRFWGYTCKVYTVTTEDGYILEIHRIPYGKNKSCSGIRQPILLMHGLYGSSFNWLWNPPHENFAFLLADDCYDVWMGNFRGNEYAEKHVKFNQNQKAFWHFSWDELALCDLPTIINYILHKTGCSSIFYVGHSMGATTMFALLSNRTEYNDKVSFFVAFAPVVYLSPSNSTKAKKALELKALTPDGKVFIEKIDASPKAIRKSEGVRCSGADRGKICSLADNLSGGGSSLTNESQVGVIKSHFPQAVSFNTLIHYQQAGEDNTTFVRYDFGEKENLEKYGQTTPPSYDLAAITTRVALIYGLADTTATPADVANLYPKLKNCVYYEAVPYDDFQHNDFIMAVNASILLYYPTTDLLNKYKPEQLMNKYTFDYYDYGSASKNEIHYDQSSPPEYDLTKGTAPVASISSPYDWWCPQLFSSPPALESLGYDLGKRC